MYRMVTIVNDNEYLKFAKNKSQILTTKKNNSYRW